MSNSRITQCFDVLFRLVIDTHDKQYISGSMVDSIIWQLIGASINETCVLSSQSSRPRVMFDKDNHDTVDCLVQTVVQYTDYSLHSLLFVNVIVMLCKI